MKNLRERGSPIIVPINRKREHLPVMVLGGFADINGNMMYRKCISH